MTVLAFDTHKAVKALREAGADEPLAEAVVATVGDAIGGNVATKTDIGDLKTDMVTKTELAALKVDMVTKTELAEVKTELAALKTNVVTKTELAALKVDITKTELAALKVDMVTKTELAEVKTELAALKVDVASIEARLYRHLWVMGASIVGLTVTFGKLFQ